MKSFNLSGIGCMAFAIAALTLSAACNDDEDDVKAPEATVALTAGTVTETSVSFTVSAENADEAAYQLVAAPQEEGGGIPHLPLNRF